jgi:hypothetical protein
MFRTKTAAEIAAPLTKIVKQLEKAAVTLLRRKPIRLSVLLQRLMVCLINDSSR